MNFDDSFPFLPQQLIDGNASIQCDERLGRVYPGCGGSILQ